jgi:large subunit ribosomal protein L30
MITMSAPKKMRVTLVKNIANTKQDHRATVRGLGLKWTNHSVEVIDTPSTRGMVNKVGYLVKVAEANDSGQS